MRSRFGSIERTVKPMEKQWFAVHTYLGNWGVIHLQHHHQSLDPPPQSLASMLCLKVYLSFHWKLSLVLVLYPMLCQVHLRHQGCHPSRLSQRAKPHRQRLWGMVSYELEMSQYCASPENANPTFGWLFVCLNAFAIFKLGVICNFITVLI